MNKYLKLLKNILILGIGSFASKLASFLLLPLYTNVLSTSEYGTVELVADTANLLIPLVSLCISDAVLRFAMESREQRTGSLSVGVKTVLFCYGLFLLCWPLMLQITLIQNYIWIVYIYVLTASLNAIMGLFARCIGYIRLYAYSGFQNTVLVVVFNLLFLLVFQWGVVGYLLSIMLADLLTMTFVFVIGNLKRYLHFRNTSWDLWKAMLRFSVPLIPNALFWWIINLSDRYLIGYLMEDGTSYTGLYSAAYKIPAFVTMVSAIFLQAWQLSAISEYNTADKVRFYSRVFSSLQMLVFGTCSALMLLIRPIMSVLVADEFYSAWVYVPFLLLAVAFQCFVNFYATLYIAAKRSVVNMLTTMIGAVSNVVLNLLLIPVWGVQGAAVSTCVSYLLVFIVRGVDCGRMFGIAVQPLWLLLNGAIVLGQTIVTILQPPNSVVYEILLFALIVLLNIYPMLKSARMLLQMRRGGARVG